MDDTSPEGAPGGTPQAGRGRAERMSDLPPYGAVLEEFVAGATPIGEGHRVRPLLGADGEQVGIHEYHRRPDGWWCGGGVLWAGEGARHQLVGLDPLHVEPSLLCGVCGSHGWIRDGVWVDA